MTKTNLLLVLISSAMTLTITSHFGQNNALHFDGIDDYVDCPAPITGDGDFTFEAQIQYEPANGFKRLVSMNGSGTRFEIGIDNGNLAYFVFPNTANTVAHTITSIELDESVCHHVAAVKLETSLLLYLDGQLEETVNNHFDNSFNLGNNMRLGRWGTSASEYWQGQIDEVRVWDVARTADELLSNKDIELTNLSSSLKLYYNFNQGSEGNDNNGVIHSIDQTNSGFNGTLIDFGLCGMSSNWIESCVNSTMPCPPTTCDTPQHTFEDNALGILLNQIPSSAPIWYNPIGIARVVEEGCIESNSVSLISPSRGFQFNVLAYNAGSFFSTPIILFANGSSYSISLCAKVESSNAQGQVICGFYDATNTTFTEIGRTSLITDADGWQTLNIPVWQSNMDYSGIDIIIEGSFISGGNPDEPITMLVDDFCFLESSTASCMADFSFIKNTCREYCFTDESCGSIDSFQFEIDGIVQSGFSDGDCYNFPTDGTYNVCLTVVSANCTDTYCESINVDLTFDAPTISCPTVPPVVTDPNSCEALVSVNAPVFIVDSCSINNSINCVRNDGPITVNDPFPVGMTTVTCTVTDESGTSASCSYIVEVKDETDPIITNCPSLITLVTDLGSCTSTQQGLGQFNATDNCISLGVSCSRSDIGGSSGPWPLGQTQVECVVIDLANNSASCNYTVEVVDNEPPIIVCPADITVATTDPFGTTITWPQIITTDNCAVASHSCSVPTDFQFPCGNTVVNCSATDDAMLSSECSFNVFVNCNPVCCNTYEEFCSNWDAGYEVFRENCELQIQLNDIAECQMVEFESNGVSLGTINYPKDCFNYDFGTSGTYPIKIIFSEIQNGNICFSKEEDIEVCLECVCDQEQFVLDWEYYPGSNLHYGDGVKNTAITFGAGRLFATGGQIDGDLNNINPGSSDIYIAELDPITGLPIKESGGNDKVMNMYGSEIGHGSHIAYRQQQNDLIVAGLYDSPTLISTDGVSLPFSNVIGTRNNGFIVTVDPGSLNSDPFAINNAIDIKGTHKVYLQDVTVDDIGNIYACGHGRGKVEIIDASGVSTTMISVANSAFGFVFYLDPSGNYINHMVYEDLQDGINDTNLTPRAIAIDQANNHIYLTGEIGNNSDGTFGQYTFINGECGTVNSTNLDKRYNGFILRMGMNLVENWVLTSKGETHFKGNAIALKNDYLYVGGRSDNLDNNFSGFLTHFDISGVMPILDPQDHHHNGYEVEEIVIDDLDNVIVTGWGGLPSNFDILNPSSTDYMVSQLEMSNRNGVLIKYDKDLNIIDGFNSGSSQDVRYGLAVSDERIVISGNSEKLPFYPGLTNMAANIINPSTPSAHYFNAFKCICPGSSTNCCAGLTASVKDVTNAGDEFCCYELDFNNTTTLKIDRIELSLNTPNWYFNGFNVLANGYTASPQVNKLILTPITGQLGTGNINGVIEFCIVATDPSAANNQDLKIEYFESTKQGNSNLACEERLILECSVPPCITDCVAISNLNITCNATDDTKYDITFDITNNSPFQVSQLNLQIISPNGSVAVPNGPFQNQITIQIPGAPLTAGAGATGIQMELELFQAALGPVNIDFQLGFLNNTMTQACQNCNLYNFQVEPCCLPCNNLTSQLLVDNPDPTCLTDNCYNLNLEIGCSFNYFTGIDLVVNDPSLTFNSFGINNSSGLQNCTAPNSQTLCFTKPDNPSNPNHQPDPLLPGLYTNLISFCLNGQNNITTNIDVIYYTIDIAGDKIEACRESKSINFQQNEQSCIEVSNARLECNMEDELEFNVDVTNISCPKICADELIITAAPPFHNSQITPLSIDLSSDPLCFGESFSVGALIDLVPIDPSLGPITFIISLKDNITGSQCTTQNNPNLSLAIPECGCGCGPTPYTNVTLMTDKENYTLDCALMSPTTLLSCPNIDPLVRISGNINCTGGCMVNKIDWDLRKDGIPYEVNGIPVLQNQCSIVDQSNGGYVMDLSTVSQWMPGTYTIATTAFCDPLTKCGCAHEWIVPEECGDCDCFSEFTKTPVIIEDPLNTGSCTNIFSLNNIGPCDQVEWRWVEFTFTSPPPPDIIFASGHDSVTFLGQDGKTYFITAIVTRTLPDGSLCEPETTAKAIQVNCGSGGSGDHQFYHDGLLHTTVGDYTVDSYPSDQIIYLSEMNGLSGLDIELKESGGYLCNNTMPALNNIEVDAYTERKIYGQVDGETDMLVSTSHEEIVMMNGERHVMWTQNYEGSSLNELIITDRQGLVQWRMDIENEAPVYYRFQNGGTDWDLPSTNTEHNHSRSNDDEIIIISPTNETIEVESNSTISIRAKEISGTVSYYSHVEQRWSGMDQAQLKEQGIILFDDQVSNRVIGNLIFDPTDGGQVCGMINIPQNDYEGIEISWPFLGQTDAYGIYHENEWSWEEPDFPETASITFEAKGRLGNQTDLNLGRIEIKSIQDGEFLYWDPQDIEASVMIIVYDGPDKAYMGMMDVDRLQISGGLPYKAGNKGNGLDMSFEHNLYWVNPTDFFIDGEWRTGNQVQLVTEYPCEQLRIEFIR